MTNVMRFPEDEPVITWRDVARVREGMILYHGYAPNHLALGSAVKISLWSRLVCWARFGLSVSRSKP